MSSVCYEIVEMEGRGKVMVATEDILPGKAILVEKPLLHYETDCFKKFQQKDCPPENAIMFATFSTFNKLSDSDKEMYLALYGPTEGEATKITWTFVKCLTIFDPILGKERHFTTEEQQLFMKVICIAKFNAFGDESSQSVYNHLTRMSHSCRPNCIKHFTKCEDHASEVRCILPVKKGEELTIEYNQLHRMKFTHHRRERFLHFKEFTCHCPRCDALGDDTRQFNCSDAKCNGKHLVCQPINKNPLVWPGTTDVVISDLHYDVAYVEPHLLPCNLCSRVPSAQFQAEMFALEARLPAIAEEFERDFKRLEHVILTKYVLPPPSAVRAVLSKFKEMKLPLLHSLVYPVLLTILRITANFLPPCRETELIRLEANNNFLAFHDAIGHFPNFETSDAYVDVGSNFVLFNSIDMLLRARECCETGLKMVLVMAGRGAVDKKKNETVHEKVKRASDTLFAVLQKLAKLGVHFAVEGDKCAFCTESEDRAAIQLSRCGRCKEAQYCSRECQTAHWKIHKAGCCKKE